MIVKTIQGNGEPRTNELELHYQGPIELAPIGDKVGQLVGGGDGTLTGPRMRGTVRWSNYETTGEDLVCALQVPGVIQTHDGALIQFEIRELAMPSRRAASSGETLASCASRPTTATTRG